MRIKPDAKSLGSYLCEKRRQAGLSQCQVGKDLRIHPQFVSNWERGLCFPPFRTLKKIARVLQIPINDFYEFLCLESAAQWKRFLEL
jgi:transcriptional regulator with XRE-family HTH domain